MTNEEIIDSIVNTAIEIANTKAKELTRFSNQVQYSYSYMNAPNWIEYDYGFNPKAIEPPIEIPRTLKDGGVDMSVYDQIYTRIMADVPVQLADFLLAYFPDDSCYQAAIAWAEAQINVGGSGINPLIENQIINRDRDRIAQEAARVRQGVLTESAARGFPIPTGAANHAVMEIDRAALAEVGKSSREVAIKQMELEFEALKEALGISSRMKKEAFDAAIGYVSNLMRASDSATALAKTNADAQASLINAAANMYSTRIKADELMNDYKYKVRVLHGEAEKQANTYNATFLTAHAAMMASTAKAIGDNAAAAISSLNAIGHSTSSS